MTSAVRQETRVDFRADDGHPIRLTRVNGDMAPTRGPVMLVHGAGVRSNLFRPPTSETVVDALVDDGWDVWLLDWRGSIDLPPNEWTLDAVAAYDHPAAVRKVCELSGSATTTAIVHCQGSTSFMFSLVAGLLPQVTTVVANAVSLHTVVPAWSRVKMTTAVPVLDHFTRYLDPSWGESAPTALSKAVVASVKLTHRECNNAVCRMVSFTYGAGRPALWRHEHLDDATHDWLRREFAAVPMSFFEQMNRCVRSGHVVRVSDIRSLPASSVAQPPQTDARIVLFAPQRNRCFAPASQDRTFAWLEGHRPGFHAIHRFETYGHLDPFLGHSAAHDVFPTLLKELAQ
jgi:hypothetical protein